MMGFAILIIDGVECPFLVFFQDFEFMLAFAVAAIPAEGSIAVAEAMLFRLGYAHFAQIFIKDLAAIDAELFHPFIVGDGMRHAVNAGAFHIPADDFLFDLMIAGFGIDLAAMAFAVHEGMLFLNSHAILVFGAHFIAAGCADGGDHLIAGEEMVFQRDIVVIVIFSFYDLFGFPVMLAGILLAADAIALAEIVVFAYALQGHGLGIQNEFAILAQGGPYFIGDADMLIRGIAGAVADVGFFRYQFRFAIMLADSGIGRAADDASAILEIMAIS